MQERPSHKCYSGDKSAITFKSVLLNARAFFPITLRSTYISEAAWKKIESFENSENAGHIGKPLGKIKIMTWSYWLILTENASTRITARLRFTKKRWRLCQTDDAYWNCFRKKCRANIGLKTCVKRLYVSQLSRRTKSDHNICYIYSLQRWEIWCLQLKTNLTKLFYWILSESVWYDGSSSKGLVQEGTGATQNTCKRHKSEINMNAMSISFTDKFIKKWNKRGQ